MIGKRECILRTATILNNFFVLLLGPNVCTFGGRGCSAWFGSKKDFPLPSGGALQL